MKKRNRIVALLAAMMMLLTMTACGDEGKQKKESACDHDWRAATCEQPQTCCFCGATQGEALAHNFQNKNTQDCQTKLKCIDCGVESKETGEHDFLEATCKAPETCELCGVTQGEVGDHKFIKATCEKPNTCEWCGLTQGIPAAHSFTAATCKAPKTCKMCGLTEGSVTEHTFTEANCKQPKTCKVCKKTEGSKASHTYYAGKCTSCGTNNPSYVAVSMVTFYYYGETLYEGETKQYEAKITPYNATEQTLKWTSSNTAVAMVDSKGNVKAISPGKCTISAESTNGKSASFDLNVLKDDTVGCSLTHPAMPKTVHEYDYYDDIKSSCKLTEFSYKFISEGDGKVNIKISFKGRKTYDARGKGQSDSCKIGWKLYDSDNYVRASGTIWTEAVAVDEGFMYEDELLFSSEAVEAGAYRLEILNVN